MSGTRHIRGHRLSPLWALGAAVLFVCAPSAQATASLFTNSGTICTVASTCEEAGGFGVLVGLYSAVTTTWQQARINYTGGADVNGEIGVGGSASGNGSTLVYNSGTVNKTWDGPIDFANALTTTSGTCGSGACSVAAGTTLQRTQSSTTYKITSTGGTARTPEFIKTSLDQMRQLSDYYAAMSGGTAYGTNRTSLGINGAHTGGLQLYTATSINQTSNMTIYGNANDIIVINVNGQASFSGTFTLNGVTADQIFFNIRGSGSGNRLTTTAGTQYGTFYVAADTYSMNSTINGRLFGSVGTSTWGANFVLNAPADTPSVPEPSTWALLAGGFGAMVYIRKRQTRA